MIDGVPELDRMAQGKKAFRRGLRQTKHREMTKLRYKIEKA
jgi:hypothetical protein